MWRKSRAFCIAALLFGILWGGLETRVAEDELKEIHNITAKERGKVILEGEIEGIEKPSSVVLRKCYIIDETKQVLYNDKEHVRIPGKVQVYLEHMPDKARLGVRLKLKGALQEFDKPENPGEFNYFIYYGGLKIYIKVYGEEAQIVEEEKNGFYQVKNWWRNKTLAVREESGRILDLCLPEEEAGVMKAMVLGDKKGIEDRERKMYQDNGIAHLLAVSGLHVSVIGMGAFKALNRAGLGKRQAAALAGLAVIFYGQMAGFGVSVKRAVFMLLLVFLAQCIGKTYDMISAACFAMCLILAQSPMLLYHSGFQLSFGAVFAIGALGKYFTYYFSAQSSSLQSILVSAAIQIVTFPIVLYHFFQYPVYGFFLNFLVIPLMSYVMVAGIAGICLGFIWLPAGKTALATGYYILKLYSWLCEKAGRLPGSLLILGRPSEKQMVFYICVALAICIMIRKYGLVKKRKSQVFFLAAGAAGLFLIMQPPKVCGVRITVLNVGQGDGILIETERRAALIDGGSTDNKKLGSQVLEPVLKSKGIGKLEWAMVSHGDEDHVSGLEYILQEDTGITIKNLVLPWLGKQGEKEMQLAGLMDEHMGEDSRTVYMKEGDSFTMGDLTVVCLYPGEDDPAADKNSQSLVALAQFKDFHMLFTGDTTEACEKIMAGRENVRRLLSKVQVLKVAHHGSDTSTSQAFLECMEPALAILSYGQKNSYGHPSPYVVERLRQHKISALSTALAGAVILETDGKTLRISTMKQ